MDITTIDNIKKSGKKDENMKITLIGRPSRELTYLAKQLYKDQYLQKVITFRYLDVNDSRETIKFGPLPKSVGRKMKYEQMIK